MVAQTFPTVDFETAKTQAANVIAKMIAGKPLETKDGSNVSLINDAQVSISTRLAYERGEPDLEVVRLEVSGPEVAERLVASREAVEKILQDLPSLKTHIKFGDDDQEATTTRALLSELINAGVDIPKEMLKWAGFSHENNEGNRWSRRANNTTTTTIEPYGVTVKFNLPDHLPNDLTMNSIKENFEARKEAILDMLADRIAKYKDVRSNQEEVKKIRTALGELQMEVFTSGTQARNDEIVTGDLHITFRSKEQIAAKNKHDKEHPADPVGLDPELLSTNILSTVQVLELSKAINRSLLTAGEGALDMAMNIAGSKDIYRVLEKSFTHFKKEKPELTEKMDEVLASTLFDDNNRLVDKSKKHEVKQRLRYENGDSKIIVDIPLPKDEAGKFIRAVAAMGGQQQAAPAVDFSKFASVDNVELVGMHSQIPALHNELQKMAAPLVGKPMEGADMDSFAKNIVNLIEQAHQQIVQGKQALRNMSDQAFEQKLAADTAPLVAVVPSPQVIPSSIAANQAPQLDVSAAHNWAEKLAILGIPQKPSSGFTLGA